MRTIDRAELSDIDVKCIYVENLPGMKIAYDIVLEAEFEISETDRHTDRYDDKTQWFKISCSGDLADSLDDFTISSVEPYDSRGKCCNPMSDSLVPLIRSDQLEDVARDFLDRNYKEALSRPMFVDPSILAKRMGLSIQMKSTSSDCSTFGQIFFADCDTEYYEKSDFSFKKTHVSKGTIFVDPESFFLRNIGSVNNTIVHECVHWDKHRKAFFGQTSSAFPVGSEDRKTTSPWNGGKPHERTSSKNRH